MERSFRGSAERAREGELDRDQVGEILKFVRVLSVSGVRLDSVDEVGPEGIEATVEGRSVVFSVVDEGQAEALTDIIRSHPEAGSFDLRSPDRVVVGGTSGGEGRG
jgi:hypothetical protein